MRIRSTESARHSDQDKVLPFHRLATESFAYQISTLSLLNPEVRSLAPLFSWDSLGTTMCVKFLPGDTEYSAAPLLGRHRNLFKLIYEVTCLCSQDVPLEDRATKAHIHDENLEEMSNELDGGSEYFSELDVNERAYRNETLLYIYTAQILTFKLLNHASAIDHSRIQYLSHKALSLLRFCKVSPLASDFLCWPILILGCCVSREEDMYFLNEKLVELWQASFCGQIRRSAVVLTEVWTLRRRRGRMADLGGEASLVDGADPLDQLLGIGKTARS